MYDLRKRSANAARFSSFKWQSEADVPMEEKLKLRDLFLSEAKYIFPKKFGKSLKSDDTDISPLLKRIVEEMVNKYQYCRLLCINNMEFLTHPSIATCIGEGGFNEVYSNIFLDGYVIRVTRPDAKMQKMRHIKRNAKLVSVIKSRDENVIPGFLFAAVERRSLRSVEIWERCTGTLKTLALNDRSLKLDMLEKICELVYRLANCGFLNYDIKLSNIAYTVQGDEYMPKIIDIDYKFFLTAKQLKSERSLEFTHNATFFMLAFLAAQHKNPFSEGIATMLGDCEPVSKGFLQTLDSIINLKDTIKKYSKGKFCTAGEVHDWIRSCVYKNMQ